MLNRFSRSMRLAPAIAALLLQACASGPDYRPVMEEAPAREAFAGAAPEVFAQSAPPDEWWRLYEQEPLNAVVEEALRGNRDLRVAAANLRRAEALLRETGNARWPSTTVDASSSSGEQRFLAQGAPVSFDDTIYSANIGVAYQVDLFGRITRAIEAAEAEAEASQAAFHAAQVTVAAETARAFAQACAAGYQLRVAQDSATLQQESFELTQRLLDAGRGTALDVSRAGALLEQLRAALPSLQARRQASLYRLAVLMGRPPADFPPEAGACASLPTLDQALPVGDGAGLLLRRPDLREAERRVAAATARIGLATSLLYPQVNFAASFGSLALSASELGDSGTNSWSFGPLLNWSFPNNTVARTRIAQAEADAQAALASFDGAWLNALREVETTLSAYARELERRQRLEQARDYSEQASELARIRFEAGQLSFLDVLQAQLTLSEAEMALAQARAGLLELEIGLFLALGGGWR